MGSHPTQVKRALPEPLSVGLVLDLPNLEGWHSELT